MKSKFVISIFVVVILIFSLSLTSFAASYIPYSGLTDSSSQASLLYGLYSNLDTFDFNDEFIILRSDQNAYYLFYADDLSSRSVNYISYIGTSSSGYNTVYEINFGVENNFSYVLNNYSVVGNIPGSVAMAQYDSSYDNYILRIGFYSFLSLFIFYIFRSHFKELTSS